MAAEHCTEAGPFLSASPVPSHSSPAREGVSDLTDNPHQAAAVERVSARENRLDCTEFTGIQVPSPNFKVQTFLDTELRGIVSLIIRIKDGRP